MYTIDEEKQNELDEEYLENSFWDNYKGLIIKIIIIILCIIVLIWLFKALKTGRNTVNDNGIHAENVLKIRLAAEDYFFIKNKKEDNKTVDLLTLKNDGLTDDIVDANNKVCDNSKTNASLLKEVDAYKMTVNLSCSTNDKEEVFYYHNNNLTCLNCNGKTKMINEIKKEINGGNNNDSNVISVNTNDYDEYSCVNWSNWSKTRINNKSLVERSKTIVQGVKYENVSKTTYGEWSEYTVTPIIARSDLEVETKVVNEDVWSDIKTAESVNPSNNIRIVNTIVVNNNDICKNGFIENDKCYSNKTKVSNLTFKEYNSGNYKIQKEYCDGIKTLKDKDGKYTLTYINCKYNEIINETANNSYTIYEYQELEKQDVTYYRSRSINTITETTNPIYTKDKYEEKDLPDGYVKVKGSEEVYYSYKYPVCEK